MIKIVTINNKGGVGKTTLSAYIGYVLGMNDKKVLLMDLDPQGNLSMFFDKEQISLDKWMSKNPILINDKMHLIPSTSDFANLENQLLNSVDGTYFLKEKVLNRYEKYFDVCILDTAPNLGILNRNALVAADKAFIPVHADLFSMSGLNSINGLIDQIKHRFNADIKREVLLNCFEPNRKRNKIVLEHLDSCDYFNDIIIPLKTSIKNDMFSGEVSLKDQDLYNIFFSIVNNLICNGELINKELTNVN